MISQLDPMIAACKDTIYHEKQNVIDLLQDIQKDKILEPMGMLKTLVSNLINFDRRIYFTCSECHELITN
jgi:hypothetical protein